FELTPGDERDALAAALADLLDADVFAEMNDYVREDLIDELSATQVADIASELDTDDAVAIIEDMEPEDQREVLRAMEPDDRAAIEEALGYPEESAGRLMQRELIAVPEHWTIGDAIDYLRGHDELTTDFWEVFVVDGRHHPVGTCALSWILRTPRSVPIADVMKREQTLAVVVRAIAMRNSRNNIHAVLELVSWFVAIANGAALGTVGAIGSYVFFHNPALSVIFALAMVLNSLVAGLVGVLVPVTLDKANVDPAVSSAVFVTTMTDVMGFFSFLGMAAWWGLSG
ncbi:MAG: magnesium transporter, partial [Sphingomonas sp.]